MTAKELMHTLIGAQNLDKQTVDTCKHGNPDRELKKVAVCLTPTPDVLRQCKEWGTDLLITHEPMVYDHFDQPRDDLITKKKLELIDTCDFTIWRFHDFIHHGNGTDGIHTGFLKKAGFNGNYDGNRIYYPDNQMTVREYAQRLENAGIAVHARIAGNPDIPVSKVMLFLGACGNAVDEFSSNDADLAIVGEITEWRNVEQMRDALQFGMNKAMILLGHGMSEMPGMECLAEKLQKEYPAIEFRYFGCGDIFSYTEQ